MSDDPQRDIPVDERQQLDELLSGSVDALPADELAQQLRRPGGGPSAARQAGGRPDGAGYPSRSHGGAAKLAQFQASATRPCSSSATSPRGRRPLRAAPERAPASATRRSASTPPPTLQQAGKSPRHRADGDTVRNSEWLGRLTSHGRCAPARRPQYTVARMLERDDFKRRCREPATPSPSTSSSTRSCRATTASPSAPTWNWGARTRRSTSCIAREHPARGLRPAPTDAS